MATSGHYWHNVKDCMEGRAWKCPEGMTLDEAITKVAATFRVKESTVRRAYNEVERHHG